MNGKNNDMQNIFNALSEKNKDIVILVAKSVKVAQESTSELYESQKQQMREKKDGIHKETAYYEIGTS